MNEHASRKSLPWRQHVHGSSCQCAKRRAVGVYNRVYENGEASRNAPMTSRVAFIAVPA